MWWSSSESMIEKEKSTQVCHILQQCWKTFDTYRHKLILTHTHILRSCIFAIRTVLMGWSWRSVMNLMHNQTYISLRKLFWMIQKYPSEIIKVKYYASISVMKDIISCREVVRVSRESLRSSKHHERGLFLSGNENAKMLSSGWYCCQIPKECLPVRKLTS